MNIRNASNQDRHDIQRVYMCAFPKDEREIVSQLAIDLLSKKATPQIISLVAETDGAIVGHIAFSPVAIDRYEDLQGYILAPLGVQPDVQKRGLGSKLLKHGLRQLSAMGVNIVFVYGDPGYYRRFGFSADTARPYITPYKLRYPFGWQAIVLNEFDIAESSVAITCVDPLRNRALW